MAITPLVIPVRLDIMSAISGLGKLTQEAIRAGAEMRKAWMQAGATAEEAAAKGAQYAESLARAGLAGGALTAVGAVVAGMSQNLEEASQFARKTAEEFIKVRQSMQEIATLSGKANNNQFTVDEARQAVSANLTPKEWKGFQAGFKNYAGIQVSPDETLGPGHKLTASQGLEYEKTIAEFFKASGIDPALGADFAGAVLTKAQGPQDLANLKKRLGVTFQMVERGQMPMASAIRALPELMAKDLEMEDAGEILSLSASAVGNGRASTTAQRAIDAVHRLKSTGKGDKYGIHMGMEDIDALKAFGQNLQKKHAQLVGQGMTEKRAQDEIEKMMRDEKIAPNIQEARGLFQMATMQGTKLGGFKALDAVRAATSNNFMEERIQGYRNSQAGQYARDEADAELANLEVGATNAAIVEARNRAKTAETRDRRFDRPGMLHNFEDVIRKAVSMFPGAASKDEQIVNRRAIEMEEAKLPPEQRSNMPTSFAPSNSETDARILEILQQIAYNTAKRPDVMVGAGVLPLSMPAPRGR